MLFDVGRRYPGMYIHHHKRHTRQEAFSQDGPPEMHYLLNTINKHVYGWTKDQVKFNVEDGFGHIQYFSNNVI